MARTSRAGRKGLRAAPGCARISLSRPVVRQARQLLLRALCLEQHVFLLSTAGASSLAPAGPFPANKKPCLARWPGRAPGSGCYRGRLRGAAPTPSTSGRPCRPGKASWTWSAWTESSWSWLPYVGRHYTGIRRDVKSPEAPRACGDISRRRSRSRIRRCRAPMRPRWPDPRPAG